MEARDSTEGNTLSCPDRRIAGSTLEKGQAGNLGITISGRCIGAGEKEHAFGYGCKM